MPTGKVLAPRISALLSIPSDWALIGEEHRTFAEALEAHCHESNDLAAHLEASRIIAQGLQTADSIDDFVDTFRNNKRIAAVAKAAIIHTILNAERDSLLSTRQSPPSASGPLSRLHDKWYPAFGKMVVAQVAVDELDRLFENLTIVCFNYDRCIEEFLGHWLTARYATSLETSRELISRLAIVRPYGQVAPLHDVAFGDTGQLSRSFALSRNINTFTEQISDHAAIATIKDVMADAVTIIFLGFGFHRQNMDLLKPDRPTRVSRILASGRGLSPPNAATIERELQQLFGQQENSQSPPAKVDFNSSCHTLFDKYGRSMNPIA